MTRLSLVVLAVSGASWLPVGVSAARWYLTAEDQRGSQLPPRQWEDDGGAE